MHTCNPSSWEVAAGELKVQDHSWLCDELEVSLSYMRLFFNKRRRREGRRDGGRDGGREREREPPLLDILVNVSACLAGPRPSGWVTQPPLWMAISSFIVYTPAAAKPLQTYSGNASTLMLAGSTVCDYESADHPGEKPQSVQKDSSLPAAEMCQPAELLQSLV